MSAHESTIRKSKEAVRNATAEAIARYDALVEVHNCKTKELLTLANMIEQTAKERGQTGVVTSLALLVDWFFLFGSITILVGSAKIALQISLDRLLNEHAHKANDLLDKLNAAMLAFLGAFRQLNQDCQNLQTLVDDSKIQHINTVSMVPVAFSPGSRMVLGDAALKGLECIITEHPEASVDVAISTILLAINTLGVEGTVTAVEATMNAADFIPFLGLITSVHGLHSAMGELHKGSESSAKIQ